MAEEYKSVLEKYNEDLARKRRLPTAEEEGIERVYPEEYLVGGPGKAVASGFLGLGKQTAKTAARPSAQIGTKVRDIADEKAAREEFAKTKWGKATYDYEKKKAQRRKEIKDLRSQEQFLLGQSERASKNIFGEGGYDTGSRMAEERRNAAGDTYKKGGKVSSASKRGDGCAVRGKTKGRFV